MHASRTPWSPVRSSFAGRVVLGLSLIAGVAEYAPVAAADPAPTGTAKPVAPKPTATATPTTTIKPDAAKTDVVKPDAVKPDAPKPMEKPDVEKPTTTKQEPAKQEPAKPEATKPSAAKSDVAKPAAPKPTPEKSKAKKPATPSVSLPPPAQPSDANPFDGNSLAGWTTPAGKPATGWIAKDGAISLPKGAKGGNLVTAQEYGSFSLSFEWKIAKGGNSGIKYRVRDYDGKILGIEYQIYDDPKNGSPKGSAGSIYDLYAPNGKKKLKPVGEFNTGRIVVRGNRIEHWLNEELIATATIGSADWHKHVAESKFNDVNGFALNPRGKLMLTDHGTEVTYRNMKFEPYADAAPSGTTTGRTRHRFLRSIFGR